MAPIYAATCNGLSKVFFRDGFGFSEVFQSITHNWPLHKRTRQDNVLNLSLVIVRNKGWDSKESHITLSLFHPDVMLLIMMSIICLSKSLPHW